MHKGLLIATLHRDWIILTLNDISCKTAPPSDADLGLVKLVVMINIFFNYHQHEIEIKRLICVK